MPLPSWARMLLFFIFLILIAVQTGIVLNMERIMAENEGFYPERKNPADQKK